ncbi:hypothetical protein ACFX15_019318 [Malus domestica]
MNGCACCLLECDMDVRVLHMSVTKEKTYFVDILVSLKESNEIGNASQDIRITEPFLAERIMHTDGNEFLGKFRTPNAKMYLSHPWKNYISNVDQDYEGGADEFRLKLCKYAVEMGFEFKKNGNQGLFPFAFALIDVEDEANWTWFLMNLFAVLSEDERTITFLSNRHKGLLQYVANVFPTSPHGFCIYHIERILRPHILLALGKSFVRKWSNYSRTVLIRPLQKCST